MRLSSLLVLVASSVAVVAIAPPLPAITPPPSADEVELRRRQAGGSIDLASLGPVLLTGVPPSILALALTNVPAVSRLLWSEFLDNNTPAWFTALPSDVQTYLKGEFEPSTERPKTTTSTPSSSPTSSPASATSSSAAAASQTAAGSQASSSSTQHHGLPLWAKILIGVLVPLLFLALLACLLLCCLRRRRHRRSRHTAESRTPTPAFISSSNPPRHAQPPMDHVPMRGGYLSSPETMHDTRDSPRSSHRSSDPEVFRTPMGEHSYENMQPTPLGEHAYEDIPPPPILPSARRGSRPSLSSLHSVPEIPEPTHDRHRAAPLVIGAIPPPRSPRRSRDLGQDNDAYGEHVDGLGRRTSPLNPAYGASPPYAASPTHNGSVVRRDKPAPMDPYNVSHWIHNPYSQRSQHDDPFSDPSPPRHSPMASGGYRGAAGPEPERRLSREGPSHEHGNAWPIAALHQGGYGIPGSRRNSWEQGDDPGHHQM